MKFRLLSTATVVTVLLTSMAATQATATTPTPGASAAACTWKKTLLPLPSGAAVGEVQATDHQGGAAGFHRTAEDQWRALSVWKGTAVTSYGTPMLGVTPEVVDQNRAGTILADQTWMWVVGPPVYTAQVSRAGKLESLPKPTGFSHTKALDIADDGDILGYAFNITSGSQTGRTLVRWPADRPTQVEALTGLPTDAYVLDADDDGTVLYATSGWKQHFLLRDGKAVALKGLTGLSGSQAQALSNGRVVGEGTYNGKEVGVLWDRDGTVKILPNSTSNIDYQINRNGTVIGSTDNYTEGWTVNDGFDVWQLDTYVTKVGGRGDVARTIGDDGTVGGFTVTDSTNTAKGIPTLWACA